MDCPSCNNEMENKSYYYYGLADWDMDYPSTLHEEYYCKNCKIKYVKEDWIIPKKYERATEKQIKCVQVINKNLGTDFIPIIKSNTTKFIKDNIDKSKQNSKKY